MGTVTVTRTAPAMSEPDLRRWYAGELSEMAHESGDGAYSGNWNNNAGLRVVAQSFKTGAEAQQYAEKHSYKRGDVLAMRVGDFSRMFPVTKADQGLVAKAEELAKAVDEFDWHVLDRAQKGKSKIRKCTHCESGINVHKMDKPTLTEFLKAQGHGFDIPSVFWSRGFRMLTLFRGMTDCPVCGKNLLKTATDLKSYASLQERARDTSKKLQEAKAAFEAKNKDAKDKPFWYVSGDCAC